MQELGCTAEANAYLDATELLVASENLLQAACDRIINLVERGRFGSSIEVATRAEL